jgi:short subunit fatty acids transporter
MNAFILNETYKQSGARSDIKKDADIEKYSLVKEIAKGIATAIAAMPAAMPAGITTGVELMFDTLGAGSIPFPIQIAIIVFCCLLIALVAYALCYPNKEDVEQVRMVDNHKQDQQASKTQDKKND